MKELIVHIGANLKATRQKKGLSQRAVAIRTKIPQSRISKIENGVTDLQTSSLIELSRVLDLELMLVPRKLIPMFKAILSGANTKEQIPMYRLDDEEVKF